MQRHCRLKLARDAIQRGTYGSVNHRRYLSTDGFLKILLVKWTHQKNWLADAGIAQGNGFVVLHHCETRDSRGGLKQSRDVHHAHSVAVVFYNCEDWPGLNSAMNLADVVPEVVSMNFDPWIKGGIQAGISVKRQWLAS